MEQCYYSPTSLNITAGIYLIAFAVLSLLKVWDLNVPFWLILVNLILGLLLIILNSLKRVYGKGDELNIKQSDKIYPNERVV